MSNAFSVEKAAGAAVVSFCGPGKGNAMGPEVWSETGPLFRSFDDDDDVRCVVVRGAGKCFSYGLDLPAMGSELGPLLGGAVGAKERARLLDVITRMQAAPEALARCKKPVIAAVHGWCIGAGLDFIAAADVRLCSASAKFSLREVKVGMVADIGSLQRLPHIIGEGAVRELALTGKDIDAARALSLGLVSSVFPDDDALFAGAQSMAQEIAANPPLVVQGIKAVMNARVQREIDAGLHHVASWNAAFLPSEDLAEAMAAFLEKRPPRFQGK